MAIFFAMMPRRCCKLPKRFWQPVPCMISPRNPEFADSFVVKISVHFTVQFLQMVESVSPNDLRLFLKGFLVLKPPR